MGSTIGTDRLNPHHPCCSCKGESGWNFIILYVGSCLNTPLDSDMLIWFAVGGEDSNLSLVKLSPALILIPCNRPFLSL